MTIRLLSSLLKNPFNQLRMVIEGILFNHYSQTQNLNYLRNHPKSKPRILFVADCFMPFGGAESRIASQIEYLQSIGYECYLFTQFNQNERLLKFQNLFLKKFFAASFEKRLLEILSAGNFDHVEFVFKTWRYIKSTNIAHLKSKYRIGCSILNAISMPNEMIDAFDYRVSFYTLDIPEWTVIKNWLASPVSPIWTYKNQKKALYIARLAPGKLVPLKNFLDICEQYGLDYD